MPKDLTIYYSADSHGELRALAECAGDFSDRRMTAGASLTIDGGDTLQGSPLMYYLYRERNDAEKGISAAAEIVNAAGYDFITLGNHDFSFGIKALKDYLSSVSAVCLCANVSGLDNVCRTAVITLPGGLTVGLTGIATPMTSKWEDCVEEAGIVFTDAFEAAESALEELRFAGCDITLCIYHGGYESSPEDGGYMSENQGRRIASELSFDLLLTSHQHIPFEGEYINGTFTCQTGDKCGAYLEITRKDGIFSAAFRRPENRLCSGTAELISSLESEMREWLDTPAGYLDAPLEVSSHIDMAINGCALANFINTVQLDATGADISCTCLPNAPHGLPSAITNRDILLSYVFINTLKVIRVDRKLLKAALERCAEYFERGSDGALRVSSCFETPPSHFNFDFFYGIEYTIAAGMPVGHRVISINYHGEELEDGRYLTLCLNNYRATGAGGYPFYTGCETVRSIDKDVQQLIFDYVRRVKRLKADRTRFITVI